MANEEFKKFVDGLQQGEKEITSIGETPKVEEVKKEEKVEEIDSKRNRRERRLEAKYQAERETSIALAERVRVLSEIAQLKGNPAPQGEIDPRLTKIFGDYEKGKEITTEFQSILNDSTKKAKEEAIKEFEERQKNAKSQAEEEEKKYVSFLKTEFDKIEDEYDVDLEGDNETRGQFVDFIQRLSPKDEEGNIKDYPDIRQAWETFQSVKTQEIPNNTRRTEVAARSMMKSGPTISQKPKVTPGFHGWREDYKL